MTCPGLSPSFSSQVIDRADGANGGRKEKKKEDNLPLDPIGGADWDSLEEGHEGGLHDLAMRS